MFLERICRCVMPRHGFNDGERQTPNREEISAGLGMGCTKHLRFDFHGGKLLCLGELECAVVLFLEIQGQGQYSNIKEQAGGERVARHIRIVAEQFGDTLG